MSDTRSGDPARDAGSTGALAHVRVLDLSRVLAGPWASQLLADLGAEVIKVERPEGGDDTRGWGPPYLRDAEGRESELSAYFLSANRGKKSVAIDITRPEGQALVRELARHSDILLENFKVGGLRKYGLDYASLASVNPGLIYCSITGFGQTGPYAPRAGYDFLIQAMGGLMSITGEPDELPGGGPMKVGVALADILTGLYAGNAVLAALAYRERSGEGQHIDLALLDVQVATLANQALNYLVSGEPPVRLGNAHPNIVPYQAFRASDGHLVLAVGNDAQFARFCAVAGRPELAADERYRTNAQRVRNRAELVPLLAGILVTRGRDAWIEALERVGVPCGPINDLGQVFAEPQVRHREMRFEAQIPGLGAVPQVASPIRYSRTPVSYRHPPPRLGEHTAEVLRAVLGLGESEIGELRTQGVVAG